MLWNPKKSTYAFLFLVRRYILWVDDFFSNIKMTEERLSSFQGLLNELSDHWVMYAFIFKRLMRVSL